MRKLIVASFVSLDGVIEAPTNVVGSYFDDECKEYAYEKLADVDLFLLGRVTYEMVSACWPLVKGDKYMDRLNGLKKLAASRTLKDVDVTWNASLIAGDVAAEIAKVKEQPGGEHHEIWGERTRPYLGRQQACRQVSAMGRAETRRRWQTGFRGCRHIFVDS